MSVETPVALRRLFYALPIPSPLKTTLSHFQKPFQTPDLEVKWQERKLMHLTLVFLGEQPDLRVDVLKEVLAQVGRTTSPFPLALEAPGAFPSFGRPRVLWMGVQPSPPLMRLQRRLLEGLDDAGILTEHRDFHPHVTLGRCPHAPSPGQRERVQAMLRQMPLFAGQTVWDVDRVHLYESHTDDHGLHYTPIGGVMLPTV